MMTWTLKRHWRMLIVVGLVVGYWYSRFTFFRNVAACVLVGEILTVVGITEETNKTVHFLLFMLGSAVTIWVLNRW